MSRTKQIVMLLVAMLIMASSFFLFAPLRRGQKIGQNAAIETSSAATGTVEAVSNRSMATPRAAVAITSHTTLSPVDAKGQTWQQLAAMREGPIEFHGLVLDQARQPVPGVAVRFFVTSRWPLPNGMHTPLVTQTVSGTDGRFALTGHHGAWLTIESLVASGYILPERESFGFYQPLWTFGYGNHLDRSGTAYWQSNSPYVFHSWRTTLPQPLVRFSSKHWLHDSEPVSINLLASPDSRQIGSATDVIVEQRLRFPGDANQPFDRILSLRCLTGGIQESNLPMPFQAPSEGYSPLLEYPFSPNDREARQGKNEWVRILFIQSRNRQLHAVVRVLYDRSSGRMELFALVNPRSSASLEPDQAKQITDPEEIRRLDLQTSK